MTNQISRKITVLFLVLMLGLAPALSYAKGDDNRKDRDEREDREEQVENREERSRRNNKICFRAFGHLFASGFLKHRGGGDNRILFENCFLPFGISKKFRGVASSTLDATAPIITSLVAKPNTIKATITWHTNEKSDSTVFWSTSANVDVNSSSTASVTKSEKTKDHNVVIEDLTASTTYFVIVHSRDVDSNTGTSAELSFQTKVLAPDNTNPVISNVVLLIGTSTIKVSWGTNENASSRLYYGTSTSLNANATTTSFVENSTPTKNHVISLNGLNPQTQYHLAAESKDPSGNRTVTPTFTASTLGL
ncbi:MAG: fibronectin type III domain-containing protein [bacterium]|nr:fibronectin type III domain-containing protein [bacterium]